jgi:ribosomal protein L28
VPELTQFVRVRLSTRALRSIAKLGFVNFCQKNGIDIVAIDAETVLN